MVSEQQRALMPPRVLPWVYFGTAHVALGLAFAAILWEPRGAAGFFYHARLAGIVHLVTIGWITLSILGALYLVGPLALRTPMPARTSDALAFALVVIGLIGMVGHFWIESFSGMAWSGMAVATGILLVGVRTLRGLRSAPIHGAVKLHITLAFTNIAAAAAAGVTLGFDKVYHFLPGYVLSNVVAHAHLAAVGWACMMVVGVAYRLLPMVIPARIPDGFTMYVSAVLLEIAALGLFVSLIVRSAWTVAFAATAIAGFGALGSHVIAMLRNRRTPPPGAPASAHGVRHAWLAFGSLAVTLVLGLVLATRDPSTLTLRLALAYGVFGLVGFLAQMIVGMLSRLLPWLAWYSAAHRAPTPDDIPPMTLLANVPGSAAIWLLWVWGVPALAAGFALDAIPLLTAGAAALEAAVLVKMVRLSRLAQYAFASGTVTAPSPQPIEGLDQSTDGTIVRLS